MDITYCLLAWRFAVIITLLLLLLYYYTCTSQNWKIINFNFKRCFPNPKAAHIFFSNKSNSPDDENRRPNYSPNAIFFWHLALRVHGGSYIRLCLSIPIDRISFVGVRHSMMRESMPRAWRLDSRARVNSMRAWSRVSFQLKQSRGCTWPFVYGYISVQGRAWGKLREIREKDLSFCLPFARFRSTDDQMSRENWQQRSISMYKIIIEQYALILFNFFLGLSNKSLINCYIVVH